MLRRLNVGGKFPDLGGGQRVDRLVILTTTFTLPSRSRAHDDAAKENYCLGLRSVGSLSLIPSLPRSSAMCCLHGVAWWWWRLGRTRYFIPIGVFRGEPYLPLRPQLIFTSIINLLKLIFLYLVLSQETRVSERSGGKLTMKLLNGAPITAPSLLTLINYD